VLARLDRIGSDLDIIEARAILAFASIIDVSPAAVFGVVLNW
jgi:hypothetical protein